MKKIINVDGREIKLQDSYAFALYFKQQTGKDFLSVVLPVISDSLRAAGDNLEGLEDLESLKIKDLTHLTAQVLENVYTLELTDLYDLVWSLAKAGNKNLEDPIEFYSEFDDFPIIEVLGEILPWLIESCGASKAVGKLKARLKGEE